MADNTNKGRPFGSESKKSPRSIEVNKKFDEYFDDEKLEVILDRLFSIASTGSNQTTLSAILKIIERIAGKTPDVIVIEGTGEITDETRQQLLSAFKQAKS